MKRVLNIEDLILYLLSENAIGDDDPPKLTVSGHLSKTQALLNLQQIIATRGTTEQFMQALERSSELHVGHKELYDTMMGERQRRMSTSSRRSSASRRTRNSITSQTQLIPVPETSPQADPPSSEEPPPTAVVVAESAGASMTHSTGAASPSTPSNTDQDQAETAPSVRRVSQPQTMESAAAGNHQHPEIKSEFLQPSTLSVLFGYSKGLWRRASSSGLISPCYSIIIIIIKFLQVSGLVGCLEVCIQPLSAVTANKASCVRFYHVGLCTIALLLAALAITTIVYGQCS